ncbi:PREDICTED: amidase 1 isoform X2 [Erythranthe guttata]|uniref:amidase 1 isoform X2 n=1 Tax=Erythranthe guttata TaxID=4155 RepID=UPI00064DA11E|nr:PREDICTED: amidase 1 isoform X2 [Erythranthe guttata]|eukprot:XP_012834962.1 PREDICTED: amidase 1 isoform X2 [Erythranthe guttata]
MASLSVSDYGAFMEKFTLLPDTNSSQKLPLNGLTFSVKDIINGENIHYGTPTNPCAPDRVPGGSSSGSAVAVAANLADFSLGTDTGGSVRVPASYCGIFGFRPSHGIVSTAGVTPMAQSFDTVGWFARDPTILKQVGKILLHLEDDNPVKLGQLTIADDCFDLLNMPSHRLKEILVASVEKLYGSEKIQYTNLGSFVEANVPSLKHFMGNNTTEKRGDNIPSLVALSSAMRLLQRYEFKNNHGEWVRSVNPDLGPGISERVWEAVESTDENIEECYTLKNELRAALGDLLGEFGILAMPTVPGPPPKVKTEPSTLENFRAKAFSLLSVAGVSGFCQVSIPLGMQDDLPIAVSLLAKHGSDGLLLSFVEALHTSLNPQ